MTVITALVGALAFGFSGTLFKHPAHTGESEIRFLLSLYLAAALVLALSCAVSGETFAFSLHDLASVVVVALGLAVGNLALVRALKLGPAGVTYPIVNTHLILLVLIGYIYYGEPLVPLQAIGIALVTIAVVGIAMDLRDLTTVKQLGAWTYLVLTAFLALGLRNGYMKEALRGNSSPEGILLASYTVALLLTFLLVREGRSVSPGGKSLFSPVGAAAGVLSATGFWLYALALRSGNLSIAAPIFGTYTLFAILGARLLYGERLNHWQMFLVFLCILGVYAVASA
jgi:drug/metabolite transporter (DMT)-like permease